MPRYQLKATSFEFFQRRQSFNSPMPRGDAQSSALTGENPSEEAILDKLLVANEYSQPPLVMEQIQFKEESSFDFQPNLVKNPVEATGGRSLVTEVRPPEELNHEIGSPLDHIYPPLVMEGFPTSETFFYMKFQETTSRGSGLMPLGTSGTQSSIISPGGQGALVLLIVAFSWILFLLFKKRSCFVNCGWKDDADSQNNSALHPM